jgi:hypothetical protein
LVRIGLAAPVAAPESTAAPVDRERDGTIEIVLTGDRRVIVGKNADTASLRRVIAVLEER